MGKESICLNDFFHQQLNFYKQLDDCKCSPIVLRKIECDISHIDPEILS